MFRAMSDNGFSAQDIQAGAAAFRAMNDSPMQQALRQRRAWFNSCVYWKPGDVDFAALRVELRRMKDLGFNAVRFHNASPIETAPGKFDFATCDRWMDAAADVGIGVVFCGGVGHPSEGLLAEHGLTEERFNRSWGDEPGVAAAIEAHAGPIVDRYREHPALMLWLGPGEPAPPPAQLMDDHDRQRFAQWLRQQYGTVEALDAAWNIYPAAGRPIAASFEEAWRVLEGWNVNPQISGVHRAKVVYGAARDLLRYLTDRAIDRVRTAVEIIRGHDGVHPMAAGAHQVLVNQAMLRWDLGRWGRMSDMHFSSIHLSWHFELVEGEVDRPVYVMAKLTRDWFKGGWTSAFETTGGAVQYSGGYGNAMSGGQMRRFMLSYLAAGNVNISFWTWNHRPGGWEAGDYGMTSLSGELTPWAEEAGRVNRAQARWIDELWQAEQDVRVGVLESWDTNAIYTVEPERYDLNGGMGQFSSGTVHQQARARIGISRALLNRHVAFEYVTAEELVERPDLAMRYPVLYAPHLRAVGEDLIDVLEQYVRRGGRLVADVQFGFMDVWGKVRPTGRGRRLERLFGAWIDTIHDARTEPHTVNGAAVEGFYGDLKTTDARVLATFDDGRAAVGERRLGRGTAVLVAFDAARMCFKPGRADVEGLIAEVATAAEPPKWRATAPLAFRLTAPGADHYFLINDGEASTCFLSAADRRYTAGLEVVEDRPVSVDGTIAVDLPARSAKWVRLAW